VLSTFEADIPLSYSQGARRAFWSMTIKSRLQMNISHTPAPVRSATTPEIADLRFLSSEAKMIDALKEIAGVFGKTLSVSPMPQTTRSDDHLFLIHFDQTRDAIAASKAMKCYLYGFSTLMVSIPRHRKNDRQ
jgi:hypothetical protein